VNDWSSVFREAVALIGRADPWLAELVLRSLRISLGATLCAAALGLPLAGALAAAGPPARRALVPLFQGAAMMPAVLIGVLVALVFGGRGGPSGAGILGTALAIGIGQTILGLVVVVSAAEPALRDVRSRLMTTVRTLGVGPAHSWWVLAVEARHRLLAVVVSAFARVVGEVGSALVLGGGSGTIAAAMATSGAHQAWSRAVALGIVLSAIAVLAVGVVVKLRNNVC
jgi:tungstate transport system permease protein